MKKIVAIFCGIIFMNSVSAQVNNYPFSMGMEPYNAISGTVISTPGEDDIYHADLPIGFSFTYNGHVTDRFGVSTNGIIFLDNLVHSGWIWNPTPMCSNGAFAMMRDLWNNNAGGTIEYLTIGTAPNRILVVQWKDIGFFAANSGHLNFQILLYETSNCVMFKYGSCINNQLNNAQCYVGLMGDSVIDYSLRQTISNDWTLNQPSANYNTSIGFPVNSTTVLPDGLCFLFGACSFLPTYTFSYLTGVVFNDANNNGAQDAGEPGIPNAIVYESLTNHFASTDTGGHYALFFTDSSLTYSLSTTPWMYWNVSSSPATQIVNPSTQNASAINFGWHATPNIHDVEIVSNTPGLTAPNSPINFYMSCHNKGTCVESGTVTLIHDSHLNFLSSNPAPDNVTGNTITWLYTNLQVLEIRNIVVHFQSDTTIQIGDTLTSYANIIAGGVDNMPGDNDFIVIQQVVTSFDPNEKLVYPLGDIVANTSLRYTLNFQNTGNYLATNIVLIDTLDADLDKTSFELIGFSHPITSLTLSGEGVLRIVFQNIMLPDSNANEPESHGYVMFRIKPLATSSVGTLIENTAGIYFDYNAPVYTNTTLNTIVELNSTSDIISNNTSVVVYPNPANDELFIGSKEKIKQVNIFNPEGKLVKSILCGNTKNNLLIQTSLLESGIYFISIETENGFLQNRKFVKQ